MAIFNRLSRKYSVELLKALKTTPLRFTDLRKIVSNEKTLSSRLKELKKSGLIQGVVIERDSRDHIAYSLTDKGTKALSLVEGLNKL